MWIIPKPLLTSLSVPATEVLTSDSPELSALCEQSLMWRSRPSPSRIWSRRWRRASWLRLLSGRILRPSIGASFVGKWISSLEGSHVNHSPAQGAVEETMTLGICGHTSPEESELSNLPLFFWKMSAASSPQDLKGTDGATEREHRWRSMSSENWREWVIEQRRAHSARSKSEHLTREREYSFSPRGEISSLRLLSGLSSSSDGQQEGGELNSTGNLHGLLFGTPRAAMAKAPLGGGHGKDAKYRIENQTHPQQGYLNPRWVEALMGVPEGWVDPFESGPLSLTNRTDELRLLGNGVVPATAERAIRVLLPRLFKTKSPRRIARASAPTS